MRSKLFVITILFLFPLALLAQSAEKVYMHKGNKEFLRKNYAGAETYYRKALEQNAQNSRARYNLGNTLLFQQKPKEAMQEYEKAAPLEKNPAYKASMYHNMGVILQSQKQFGPAIECYKEALRNNSYDNETRYNLALCQYQMKNQDQNQDKDKDKKNEEQKQQEKQKQQSDPDKNPKKEQNKGQKNEMSKDNADQLLRAAQMKENRTQDKVRKAQLHANRRQMENNW